MALMNGSKRARYTSSITNQSQGGGSKKAGLVSHVGMSSWMAVHYQGASGLNNLLNMRTNRTGRFPSQNLPMGFHGPIRMR